MLQITSNFSVSTNKSTSRLINANACNCIGILSPLAFLDVSYVQKLIIKMFAQISEQRILKKMSA